MPEAGIQCSALEWKASPSVLSFGSRAMEGGFSFGRRVGGPAVLESRGGGMAQRSHVELGASAHAC